MKNCFDCVHKKVDLWNFEYSDKNAHICLKGNNDIMYKFRESVVGLSTDDVKNNPEFELPCFEMSEEQKKIDGFFDNINELLDKLKKTIEDK